MSLESCRIINMLIGFTVSFIFKYTGLLVTVFKVMKVCKVCEVFKVNISFEVFKVICSVIYLKSLKLWKSLKLNLINAHKVRKPQNIIKIYAIAGSLIM